MENGARILRRKASAISLFNEEEKNIAYEIIIIAIRIRVRRIYNSQGLTNLCIDIEVLPHSGMNQF